MEKIDVLKVIRDNQDKFKQHVAKIKELEEKEKELSYGNLYKNQNSISTHTRSENRLSTIPEGENETHSIKKPYLHLDEENSNNTRNNKYIYQEVNDVYNSGEDNIQASEENINEKISKEIDYNKYIRREEAKNENRSEPSYAEDQADQELDHEEQEEVEYNENEDNEDDRMNYSDINEDYHNHNHEDEERNESPSQVSKTKEQM